MYEQSDLALIGSRIKAVRTGKGMSQADLAVKASVSLPLISNIERGKTRMQLETFVKVCLFQRAVFPLGFLLRVSWIMTGFRFHVLPATCPEWNFHISALLE